MKARILTCVISTMVVGWPAWADAAGEEYGDALATADFNGDGHPDLAIGMPKGQVARDGTVSVLYGSAGGLVLAGQQVFTIDPALDCILVGETIAGGDFNGDHFDDLAFTSIDLGNARGRLDVCYGSAQGLATGCKAIFWSADDLGPWGPKTMAVADFDQDGRDDLVVGHFDAVVNGRAAAGAIQIWWGNGYGLDSWRTQVISQNSGDLGGEAEASDYFGTALAVGFFNGDTHPDLAVGSPGETLASMKNAGAVHVLYGWAGGLNPYGTKMFTNGGGGLPGPVQTDARVGASLASGNFGYDRPWDLAIGAPGQNVAGANGAGVVYVMWGNVHEGIVTNGVQTIRRGSPAAGTVDAWDSFGGRLLGGKIDYDGFADLIVAGSLGTVDLAITYVRGGAAGLVAAGSRVLTQDTPGIAGRGDLGPILAGADFNNDNVFDIAVGTPSKTLTGFDGKSYTSIGCVNILSGSAAGPQHAQVFAPINSPDFNQ